MHGLVETYKIVVTYLVGVLVHPTTLLRVLAWGLEEFGNFLCKYVSLAGDVVPVKFTDI
jgi:hypothetical protein